MKDVNNYDQIARALMDDLEEMLDDALKDEISEHIEDQLRKAIDDKIYARPSHSRYDRTYEMRNAITVAIDVEEGNPVAYGFIDPNKLTHIPYIAHSSWVDGSDQREFIAHWMEYGNKGTVSNKEPIVEYDGRFYFKYAFDNLDKSIVSIVRMAFRNMGYSVK